MTLDDISEIKTGLVLARKKANIEFDIKAEYRLLTLKNIEDDGMFNDEPFDVFQSNAELDQRYFTEEDDILVRLSHPNTVVYIKNIHTDLLVPSYFSIIKIRSDKFLPKYVAWYLNTDTVKNELIKSQSGTHIPSTNKNILKSIHIEKMPLQKQQAIIHLQQLHQRETLLYKQLIQEKEKYYRGITRKIMHTK